MVKQDPPRLTSGFLRFLTLSLLSQVPLCCNAFKSESHLLSKRYLSNMTIVAKIAYDKLEKESPKALARANDLLSALSDKHLSHHNEKEGDYPFVECATLADDIKYTGGGWQSDWHFVDNPWYD